MTTFYALQGFHREAVSLHALTLVDMFRWDINKALPAAAMLARPSMDLQQTSSGKQQTDGHTFVASSSAQARARQNLDKGD